MSQAPLYGLILIGGKSKRMGTDKAWLSYHGRPQVLHLYQLLTTLCDAVFLSFREGQRDDDPRLQGLPYIHDEMLDAGPIAGILAAQSKYPEAAWLVLACDLPCLTKEALIQLMESRDTNKFATCFTNVEDESFPEPLCAIYEPKSQYPLREQFARHCLSPSKFLRTHPIKLVEQIFPGMLKNINHLDEFVALSQQD
ncbi:MAG: NTP transferase domain-containing protein [Oligoflexus sp.]